MPSVILPPEVVERIIDCCHDNSYTLRQLTLTCRQLLPRSRSHLFSSIRVEGASLDTLYLFYDTLDAQPWLRFLIRSIKIVAHSDMAFEDTQMKPNLLDVIPATLLTLPCLTQWTIVGDSTPILPIAKPASFTPRALASYGKCGSTIRVLCLQDIEYMTGDDFWRFLSAFPFLRNLCCEGITFEQPGVLRTLTQPGYRRPRELQLDTLETGGLLADDAIAVLVESCSHSASLESLSLDVNQAECFFPCLSQLPGLHHLTLEIKLGDENTIARSISRLVKVLKLFAELPISSMNGMEFILRMSIMFPPRLNYQLAEGEAPRLCQTLERQLLSISRLRRVIFRFRVLRTNRERFWMVKFGHHFPQLRQRGLVGVCAEQVTAIGHDDVTPPRDSSTIYHNTVNVIAISPDNEWVASGSMDTTIIIWCLKKRCITHEWVAHRGPVACLAFSPDGQNLMSGGRDSNIVIWDISLSQGAQMISTLDGYGTSPEACAWSPAQCGYEPLVACAFLVEGQIHVWDVHTLQRRYSLAIGGPVYAQRFLTFSPDGRWLASQGEHGSCTVREPMTGALHTVLQDAGLIIHTAVFDPSGRRIATTSGRGNNALVQLWDVEAGVRLLSFGKGLLGPLGGLNVSFSPDGRTVLSMGSDHPTIWDASTGEENRALHGPGCTDIVFQLCFSPDGRYVAATSFDGEVKLWRVRDGAYVATLSEHRSNSHSRSVAFYVGFSAEAETIFYTCGDGTVYMYGLRHLVERSSGY